MFLSLQRIFNYKFQNLSIDELNCALEKDNRGFENGCYLGYRTLINAYRFARESILLNFVDQISPFCFLGLVFNWDGF